VKDSVPNIVIREALPKDAEQIVDLFNITYNYGYGVDECRCVEKVRKIIEDKRDLWFVATDGDKIAASTVGMPNKWNRTYETCRGATNPTYRRMGAATELYKTTLEACFRQVDCDLTFGFPRTFGMYQIMYKVEHPFLLTGYDGGMHITDKKRELHLVGMTKNPYMDVTRIIPSKSVFVKDGFIIDDILSKFDFENRIGDYPNSPIVGDATETCYTVDGLDLDYLHLTSSHSVQILGASCKQEYNSVKISEAIEKFLSDSQFKIEHAFVYVLAEKEKMIKELHKKGFEMTAYLPAWYHEDDTRYDCVMMAKRMYAEEPITHNTAETINNFKTNFSRMLEGLQVI
jgi:hypothetical protein